MWLNVMCSFGLYYSTSENMVSVLVNIFSWIIPLVVVLIQPLLIKNIPLSPLCSIGPDVPSLIPAELYFNSLPYERV